MNLCGGYLNHYGDYSTAQIAKGLSYTYGGWANNNSFSDLQNAKLNVQFGNNPAETRMSGGGLIHHYVESKNISNVRTIIIDRVIQIPLVAVKISGSQFVLRPMRH